MTSLLPTVEDRAATAAVPTESNRRQFELQRARRILERELSPLLRPSRLDTLLCAAIEEVVKERADDPALRLRAVVGARLLDEVGDVLGRAAREIPPREPSPTRPWNPPANEAPSPFDLTREIVVPPLDDGGV